MDNRSTFLYLGGIVKGCLLIVPLASVPRLTVRNTSAEKDTAILGTV